MEETENCLHLDIDGARLMVRTNYTISIKNIPVITFTDSFAEVGQGRWEGCGSEERTAGGRAAKSQNPNEVISIMDARSSQQGRVDGGTERKVAPVLGLQFTDCVHDIDALAPEVAVRVFELLMHTMVNKSQRVSSSAVVQFLRQNLDGCLLLPYNEA